MRIPKTPVEFDYDLWTTEDGKCMVRVKATGEVTEVDRDVMRLLRAEEKKLRRSMTGVPISGCEDETATLLSLDYVSYPGGEDMEPSWLMNPISMEDEVITGMLEAEFVKTLTDYQREIYEVCMKGGMRASDFARSHGVDYSTVRDMKRLIIKKSKKFFRVPPKTEN
ncbi:MAG: hypothetical protein HP061_00055 [Christensenellaceae bacterium]|nr:hypothetical protein [Christensenellaceae bacterium]